MRLGSYRQDAGFGDFWGEIARLNYAMIKIMDSFWFVIASNLFVNLSAGWFAAALIVPATSKRAIRLNFWVFTIDILFGIFCLVAAFYLGKIGRL